MEASIFENGVIGLAGVDDQPCNAVSSAQIEVPHHPKCELRITRVEAKSFPHTPSLLPCFGSDAGKLGCDDLDRLCRP
ncbi:hypothetical protein [Pseudomonas aeruginosa]|uniref:hypothetical protein n=1 Tax=Pseudomonas aeruginosa TaxID=287 RepID=UPI0034E0C9B7